MTAEGSDKNKTLADALPAVPDMVGRYRIESVIGRGAMGVVYKGYDTQIDRPVAIKSLRSDVISHVDDRTSLLERFASEARSAGRCHHPNIVTVFDYVEQDASPFIIMEYVSAGTLENVTKSKSLMPIHQVGEIMAQLLAALGHAHENGVIHRDVKPANILCPTATTIKVTDFGVARIDDLGLTAHGGAIGTPSYMSPEQFLGQPVDARSDLFAVGVLLFQLLTGTKPFKAQGIPALMQKVLNEPPLQLSTLRPELSPLMQDVIDKALARHPGDRFATAAEFAGTLGTAIKNVDDEATAPLDLTEVVPARDAGSTDASQVSMSSQSDMNQTMADRMTPDLLSTIELALARSIGPIAKLVVRRASRESTDADQLLTTLCAEIPEAAEALKFRQEVARTLRRDTSQAGTDAPAMPAGGAVSPEEIASASEALLPVVGPMARIIAKRSADKATSRSHYYQLLGESIPDLPTREAFLARYLR